MFKSSSADEDNLARYEVYLGHLPRGLPPWERPNDKKALFIAELTAFAGRAKRIRDAIEREDLAKSADRPRILRLALVEGIARYYRAHPNADAAPGVFALIIVLADNDAYGACYLSMTRWPRSSTARLSAFAARSSGWTMMV